MMNKAAFALLNILAIGMSVPALAAEHKPLIAKSTIALHEEAFDLALSGKTDQAIYILSELEKRSPSREELDQIELTLGRLYFEKNEFAKAMAAYQRVERGGPHWLEAYFEEAWVDFRAGRAEDSIAKLQTVTLPVFTDRMRSSEPFFLLALAQLRTCDYKALFKTIDQFKTRYRPQVRDLEAARSRDPNAKVQLAAIDETIQKLNLVEAEAIQRLYLDENGKRRSGSVPKIAKSSDQLTFPQSDGGEVWIDELEGYKVTLKGCVASGVASTSINGSSPGGVRVAHKGSDR